MEEFGEILSEKKSMIAKNKTRDNKKQTKKYCFLCMLLTGGVRGYFFYNFYAKSMYSSSTTSYP